MKKLCYFLLFLLISLKSFSQENEKLPKTPWEDIVEMNSSHNYYNSVGKWEKDWFIKLEGKYNKIDSIEIARIITKLNSLTETISIKFSKLENSNIKINFLDNYIKDNYDKNKRIDYRLGTGVKNNYNNAKINIYKIDSEVRQSLEANLAKLLVRGNLPYNSNRRKRNSIFYPFEYRNNNHIPLNDQDVAIIREIYKSDFRINLEIAKKQFEKKIKNSKISNRDRNLWWVNNPLSVIFLPILVLIVVSLLLINKIRIILTKRVKNNLLNFTFLALVASLFLYVIVVFYYNLYQFLRIPVKLQDFRVWNTDVVFSIILLFPSIYLFRFLEIKIQKSSNNVNVKTLLIFLSTGFLPFLVLIILSLLFNYLNNRAKIGGGFDYRSLSDSFLFLMIIASIRAFISYFIFKERNLIIENETKISNLRELKTKAELKLLQSQINPHFLYNALNSIASLAHTNADKTEKMALSLSDLFKYTINRKGKKTSTINDELEMVRSYLEIEQTRFGDRLEFVINAKEEVLNEEIPMFILQPLVENAVKHGTSKIEGIGIIKLNILKTVKGLDIEVKDNGPDFPEGLVSGHGLQTVYDLLRLTYADKASLKWQNTPQKGISILIDKTI